MRIKIEKYKRQEINKEKMGEIFQGWNAYACWGNSFKLRKRLSKFLNP